MGWTKRLPPVRGKVGMGGAQAHVAKLFTPTLPLPRLRGRGAFAPFSCGLI
jgi:hypothetical protein